VSVGLVDCYRALLELVWIQLRECGSDGLLIDAAEFRDLASSGDGTQPLLRQPLKYFVVFFIHVTNK
jgi:hypothetical protein